MGLFQKFKAGLQKTQTRLFHEIKRIFTGSPKLTGAALDELETALIAADFGMAMTSQIVVAVKKSYETQGAEGLDVFGVARREVEQSLGAVKHELRRADSRAALTAGSNSPIRIPMMAMTTRSSTRVKPLRLDRKPDGKI